MKGSFCSSLSWHYQSVLYYLSSPWCFLAQDARDQRAKFKAELSLHCQSCCCECGLPHTCPQQNFLHLLKHPVLVKWAVQVERVSYLCAPLGLEKKSKQSLDCQVGNECLGKLSAVTDLKTVADIENVDHTL